MTKHSQTSAQNVTSDKTEETSKNNDKKAEYFFKFCCAIMDVDFFACFDAIILEKKRAIFDAM